MNSVELKDKQSVLYKRCLEIVDTCKAEVREMTEEEFAEFDANKVEIENLRNQLSELESKLNQYDDMLPSIEETRNNDKISNKESIMTKENFSIVKEIRSAMENGSRQFSVNADTEKRAVTVDGAEGVHDNVIETEIQGILEPLYANSVLSKLGVKWYTGMPMGDISIPVMGKGNVGWESEIASASGNTYAFTNKVLRPKRLTAFVDISKKMLAQDTIGVENAIRRDIVNALNDKLEATILGSGSGSTTQPAGIFYDASATTVSGFAGVCDLEATVEDANVYGDMKYLLSTSAKADFRAMPKSSKNTQLVMEGGQIDGVPAITTSNVKEAGAYIYGDFSNLAVASWGNIDITVDEYTQAVNGCVRLVINAYFDAVILRPEAFAFGKTR